MTPKVTLTQKYAPRCLSDITGQEFPKKYFQAVAANPGLASRNYVITGPRGVGKTSLVRAFTADLIGDRDIDQSTQFLELDSYQIQDRSALLGIKDFIFQEVNGYKVVLLDEWHLVDPSVQAGLLKDIETCSLPIFFFFVSTEQNGILDTIFSRSLYFTLSKFSTQELRAHLDSVLDAEGYQASDALKEVIVFKSFGHVRDLLNQAELAMFVGPEQYMAQANTLLAAVECLFLEPSRSCVEALALYPWTVVQGSLDHYIHERLVKAKELFEPASIVQIFSFYLKYKRYIQNESDFFSFLILFSEMLTTMRRARV